MERHEEKLERLQEQVLEEMDLTREVDDEELVDLIYHVVEKETEEEFLPLREKSMLGRELFNSFRKLNVLQELLEDDTVTEIMINGTQNIFIERGGRISQSGRRFISKGKLEDIIQQIVAGVNRIVNESTPIVDARLPDGSRVHVVLSPVALNGPIVTIRKFPKQRITMEQLCEWDSVSKEAAEFLEVLMQSKMHILISGSTGSGKTTFLNALSNFIPKDERMIVIEDNAELQIEGIPNLVRLETRNANTEGEGEISIRQLIKAALRMRPSRIIVGEVRSVEAVDMLQALNTGHPGASTIHANSAKDALGRLETMVLMGMNIPLEAVQRQIASGLDILIHLGRLRDKTRRVLEIVEILDYEKGEVRLNPLFRFEETGVDHGKIQGVLKKVGELKKRDKFVEAGY